MRERNQERETERGRRGNKAGERGEIERKRQVLCQSEESQVH